MPRANSAGRINWSERLASLLLWTVTVTVILISVSDLTGVLQVKWLENRFQTITLLAVGVVLLTVLVERHTSLSRLVLELTYLRRSALLRAEYLADSDRVVEELFALVDNADERILALGGKSTADPYLDRIGDKVTSGQITYSRLLTGDHITHELHQHLKELLSLETVTVAWTGREKYTSMTVSEKGAVLLFPTPHPKRFRGLRLEGAEHATHLGDVFRDAGSDSKKVTLPESLELLCENCGPDIRDSALLSERLEKLESREASAG
jgi:hypothetical protein